MATHDVDQKTLARLARFAEDKQELPLLASALFKVLGISTILARHLVRARRVRKLDISRDTKSMALYHHIIFLTREAMLYVENRIYPQCHDGRYGTELRIFSFKLKASIFHIFALFHNQPPVTQLSAAAYAASRDQISPATPSRSNGSNIKITPPSKSSKSSSGKKSDGGGRDRRTGLRDTIPSMVSDVTNPYAISPPPGFTGLSPVQVPHPGDFLMPAMDFRDEASRSFLSAYRLACTELPGSSPIRLSIALEYCAYLWDCLGEHSRCRRLASEAIKAVYREEEGMDDRDFEDAVTLVGTLGRMMKRRSHEGTPRLGPGSPGNPGVTGVTSPPPVPTKDSPSPKSKSSPKTTTAGSRTVNPATTSSPTRPVQAPAPVSAAPRAPTSPPRGRATATSSIPRRPVRSPPAGESTSTAASNSAYRLMPYPAPRGEGGNANSQRGGNGSSRGGTRESSTAHTATTTRSGSSRIPRTPGQSTRSRNR